MAGIYIGADIFIVILIPTLLISALPRAALKILELFRSCKKGSVYTEVSDYITGAGMSHTAKVYISIGKNRTPEFVKIKFTVFLSQYLFRCQSSLVLFI